VSSRGGRVPNYVDDVQDFEKFETGNDTENGYYADPNVQYEEEHEIEAVLGHSRDEGHENDPEDRWFENIVSRILVVIYLLIGSLQRYHIKWKSFSHLHNTDEIYEFLKRFRGLKRVDNYIKAYKLWQSRVAAPGLTQEDIEALHLDKEREKEELDTWRTVERIIAHRESLHGDMEYFCKWCSLSYEHCTWEPQAEINSIAKEQIRAYRQREADGKFPYKSVTYGKHGRPTFKKIDQDPDYIANTGGELKDFQLTGLNWLAYLWSKGENGILADEMGLGKVMIFLSRELGVLIPRHSQTVQTVAFLSYLFHEMHQYGPFLVIVPLSTITAWQTQFAAWAPDMNVITYIGTAAAREVIRSYEFGPSNKKLRLNVLLTTYELTLRDAQQLGEIKWQALAVDEVRARRLLP